MRLAPFAACFLAAIVLALGSASWVYGQDGFVPIFNGENLDGWDGNPKFWRVEEGCIVGQTTEDNPTDGNTFCIWRAGEVDDFELTLEYHIVGGNSGIQYRSTEVEQWRIGGYQADIDSGDTYSGILYDERGRGILAGRGELAWMRADGAREVVGNLGDSAQIQEGIRKEDWNTYRLIVRGNEFTHLINGRVTAQFIDDQVADAERVGLLALQLHAGPPMTVKFRNIQLKRLALADGLKKVVLVAGTPSHAAGDHEFNAGSRLLKKCLDQTPGVLAALYLNGWPQDPTAFDNADTIFLYMDGGGGHPLVQVDHLEKVGRLMEHGVGLVCAHYAVEVPKENGGPELLSWIGGYYETGYSINPHWTASFAEIPVHPTTRGVEPFEINDEWYYNIRFREGLVTPILQASPPDDTRRTPAAAEHTGRSEIVAWATDRADGGRGFGFTGGHVHHNWGNDNFRRLILNAILWSAGAEVPEHGVVSTITEDELAQNLDPK